MATVSAGVSAGVPTSWTRHHLLVLCLELVLLICAQHDEGLIVGLLVVDEDLEDLFSWCGFHDGTFSSVLGLGTSVALSWDME